MADGNRVTEEGHMEIKARTEQEELGSQLLGRCRRDDPAACNQLFALYNRRIFNTAFRILGEESSAEDAMQETLINIYRGIHRFRGASRLSTWVSRITVNVCLGMIRKGKNRRMISLDDETASQDLPAEPTPYLDPLKHAVSKELADFIEETFRRMSEKQRRVVRLHDMEGNTIPQVARILHCPVGTVKSRLFYGRQEFKDIYNALLAGRSLEANLAN
jgi:RNA polymerase sigma-70 factor (ECF subfamily)